MSGKTAETTVNPRLLAYLAGRFEGRGSISVQRTETPKTLTALRTLSYTYQLKIGVNVRSEEVAELYRSAFGGHVRHLAYGPYYWSAAASDAAAALKLLKPYLRERKEQVALALELSAKLNPSEQARAELARMTRDTQIMREAAEDELRRVTTQKGRRRLEARRENDDAYAAYAVAIDLADSLFAAARYAYDQTPHLSASDLERYRQLVNQYNEATSAIAAPEEEDDAADA